MKFFISKFTGMLKNSLIIFQNVILTVRRDVLVLEPINVIATTVTQDTIMTQSTLCVLVSLIRKIDS